MAEPSPEERRLARSLRDQAYADLAQDRYAEGIAKLQEAYALVPNPGLLLNVAIAYRRWGEHCAESLRTMDRFEAVCAEASCPFFEEGRDQRALLENSCTGELRVLSSPFRAQIRLDDRPRGLTPMTLRLEPGPYTLTASSAVGGRRLRLDVRPGQLQELRLIWSAPSAPPRARLAAGWIAAGVAATGLVTGVVFTALAVDSGNEALSNPEPVRSSVDSRRDREWAASAVGYGFALGGGATAAWLLLAGRGGDGAER